jgi:hypothetical protein
MQKFAVLSIVILAAAMFAGCGDSGSSSGSVVTSAPAQVTPPPPPVRVVSKAELGADIQRINAGEADLMNVGFGFLHVSHDGRSGFKWDPYTYRDTAETVSAQSRILALQNYVQVTNDYIAKYSGNFRIEGEHPNRRFEVTNLAVIVAKNALAKKTLDDLIRTP